MTAASRPLLDPQRARDLVKGFAGQPVLVVGDVMLDRFIVGRVTRISPEAPVPIVRFQSEELRLGGAANVAHNVAALGGRPTLIGLVGDDGAAERLRNLLREAGIGVSGLVVDRDRPTTEKVRIVTERKQQIARIDYEDDADVSALTERAIVGEISRAARDANALLVSDYLKGLVTRPIVESLLGSATLSGSRKPLVVDPKIPHLASYAGATLVTPNHHEAETATHLRIRSDDEAREAACSFRRQVKCEAVLITRGELGMWLSTGAGDDLGIPANTREVSDVTGAGDTVVSTIALALAAGATLTEAAVLANHAAGIVVGKFGPATVTPDELMQSVRRVRL